ncbi:MAG: replicative DNA helicase [Brevundimonas sp.]|uniref:replicative DNA helicase n=1 Tax=Brevundimonas sp. TaxID=1871086 RepID=UPI003918BCF6
MMDPRDQDDTGRAMPANLDAEQALLGVLMFDAAAFERLPDRFKAEHFNEPFHQRLFQAVADAVASGRSADPTILKDALAADPAFAEYGGLAFLHRLVDAAPTLMMTRDLARTIYELAQRRDLIRIGGEITEEAMTGAKPVTEQMAAAEGALFSLAESGEQSKGVILFRDALHGAIDMAEAAFRRDGALAGLATGLTDLDQKLGGLHPSDLLVLAGRPSMGKTALATNIGFHVAKNYRYEIDADAPGGIRRTGGGRVLFFSLEMSPEQLAMRILADAAGVSGDRIRKGHISREEFGRLKDVQTLLSEIPLLTEATGGITIGKLAAIARRQHRKVPLDLIIVDYLQLATVAGGAGKARVQEISEITGGLKALAKELNVPIIALSQLSRQVENRDDKRPQLSDLRESGSIEQDADAVMFVYRESYYLGRAEPKEGTAEHLQWQAEMAIKEHEAEVIIGKQRHGPIGTVKLAFDADTTRFGNLARGSDYETARMPYGDQ